MKNEYTTSIYEQNMENLLQELAEKGYTAASLQADKKYLDQITSDIIVPFLTHHLKNFCWGLLDGMSLTKMDGVGECTMKILDKLDYILSHEGSARLPLVQTVCRNHIYSLYRHYMRHKPPIDTRDDFFWSKTEETLADLAAEDSDTAREALTLMAEVLGKEKNLLVVIRLLSKICGVSRKRQTAALQKYGDVAVAIALMERTTQKLDLPASVFPLDEIRKREPNFYVTFEPKKLEKKFDNAASYKKDSLRSTYFRKKRELQKQKMEKDED